MRCDADCRTAIAKGIVGFLFLIAMLLFIGGCKAVAAEIFYCDVTSNTLRSEYQGCLEDKQGSPQQCKQLVCAASSLEQTVSSLIKWEENNG